VRAGAAPCGFGAGVVGGQGRPKKGVQDGLGLGTAVGNGEGVGPGW
jgi:hypothetical protein